MKSFISWPVFSLSVALLGYCLTADAGYAQAKLPGFNVGTSGGSYSYQGSAAVNQGSFWTTGTIIVGGKTINLGTSIPLAANVAEFAVGVIRGNPAIGAALAIGTWLIPYGISLVDNQWWMQDPSQTSPTTGDPIPSSDLGWICSGFGPGAAMTVATSCAQQGGWNLTSFPIQDVKQTNAPTSSNGWTRQATAYCGTQRYACAVLARTEAQCASGFIWSGASSTCVSAAPALRPATDADWAPVKAATLPDPVADGLADTVALPVQAPVIQPKTVPISEPYLDPAGVPHQDVAEIVPAPEQGPSMVEIKTGTETLPGGTPVPATDPTHPDVTVDPKPDQEKYCASNPDTPMCKWWCDQYPDSPVCKPLGEHASPTPLQQQSKQVSITPVSIGGGGGCPSPVTFSVRGYSMSLNWDLICGFASGIRPIVIGLAWFFAGSAFLFGARRHG